MLFPSSYIISDPDRLFWRWSPKLNESEVLLRVVLEPVDFAWRDHSDHASTETIITTIHMQYAVAIQHIKEMMAIRVVVFGGGIARMIDDAVCANELRTQVDIICHKIKPVSSITGRMKMWQ